MLELFLKAGWVAYPLGLCSILALGIILERFFTLARLKQLEEQAFVALQGSLRSGTEPDETLSGAPVAQIVESLRPLRGSDEETVREAADIALAMQRMRLRRYLGTLATIGSTAPFIGLFGTVIGVMVAFHGMSQSGLSGETMAAGISEALSATALGLVVAVPSVIAYNFFLGRVQGLTLEIQSHLARLAPLLAAPERVAAGGR